MTITNRTELDLLPDAPRTPRRSRRLSPPSKQPSPKCRLTVPPPASGLAYTQREVAKLMGAKLQTIHQWVSIGRTVVGRQVRLRSLRAPRGAIAPADLCEFLGEVNGCQVQVGSK